MDEPDNAKLEKIIVKGNADTLISYALTVGQGSAGQELGRTQIRNIYSTVKSLQARKVTDDTYRELKLLIPKLDYAAARKQELTGLAKTLIAGIRLVGQDAQRFKHFVQFFEAIVAYHYSAIADQQKDG